MPVKITELEIRIDDKNLVPMATIRVAIPEQSASADYHIQVRKITTEHESRIRSADN